jgi:predicted PurR-regulated permease PerM
MSPNTTDTARGKASTNALPSGHGRRRKLITALTVLAFIAIAAVALYAISLIVGAVILLIVSALLAYIIYPLVQFFQRRLRPSLAIAVAYLLVASALAIGMYIVTSSLIRQSSSLAQSIQFLLSPAGERQIQPFIDFLGKVGITNDQVAQFKNQLFSQVLAALSGLFPFLTGLFTNIINLILVITLSVYFVIDGPRIIRWLRLKTPVTQRGTINFLLHTLDQSLGGYLRGALLLALIGALCTGIGLALLHVPYAALLGALFFLLYFVPVIGAYVIGVLCILAALPQGWVVTLIVAVYITLLQGVVIGQVLSPRIFSKTVGVHPIVALFALFAGAELFGLLGGLLAVPVAGVLQQIIAAIWHRWENEHSEQFPPEEVPPQPSVPLPSQQVLPPRPAERS